MKIEKIFFLVNVIHGTELIRKLIEYKITQENCKKFVPTKLIF